MPLIRPELAARLHPWREVIAAAALGLFGLWTFSLGGLLFRPLGVLIGLTALGWGIGAWRRTRFRTAPLAAGVVELDEGVIRYLGPRALGGEVALRDLIDIRLLRLNGRRHWRLRTAGGEALLIPAEAAGAQTLADAFVALPGFDLGLAAAAFDGQSAVAMVWQRR